MSPRRRKLAVPFLLGAASLLLLEVIVAGLLFWRPTEAIAGNAQPMAAISTTPTGQDTITVPGTTTQPTAPTPAPPTEPSPAPANPAPSPQNPAPKPPKPVAGQQPGTIKLPDGRTAKLVRKEITGDATLPVPESLGEATWWGAGLNAPTGASVFAGHVNWKGQTGPFAGLWNSKVNEQVSVTDSAGKAFNYRVSQIITLHKDELPARASSLFSQSGSHRLVLVTCGGQWLGGSTGYAENRIVIADPVA